MGIDHSLSCIDCREEIINVGRKFTLVRDNHSLDVLEAFLNKHADHRLIYDADDDYARVPDAKKIYTDEDEKVLLEHLGAGSRIRREERTK